jgi:hypothetical protein
LLHLLHPYLCRVLLDSENIYNKHSNADYNYYTTNRGLITSKNIYIGIS